jgi:sulfur transfer protein SufE
MDEIFNKLMDLKDDLSHYKQKPNSYYLSKFFIEKGNLAISMIPSINQDINKIGNNTWMKCYLKDNRLYFDIASETYIGNGIAHCMSQIFSNSTPKQLTDFDINEFYDIFDDNVFLIGQKPTIDIIMNKIVDYAVLYGRNEK